MEVSRLVCMPSIVRGVCSKEEEKEEEEGGEEELRIGCKDIYIG